MIDFPNIKNITSILSTAALSCSNEEMVQVPRSALCEFLLYSTMLKSEMESQQVKAKDNVVCISDIIIVSDTIVTN